jgi:predicted nucleic acid-binding protein
VGAEWEEALRSGRIVTCAPIALELLHSAETISAFDDLAAGLDALRSLPLTETVLRAARSAMRELAARTRLSHRLPPLDYVVAALAHEHGAAVLHYDAHFDRLATVLAFDSIWLAPRGTLP